MRRVCGLPRFAQINLSVKVLLLVEVISQDNRMERLPALRATSAITNSDCQRVRRRNLNESGRGNRGGLAGVRGGLAAANLGVQGALYEMRPRKKTPPHQTDKLAEIVCSNSLKSDEPGTASYLLKKIASRDSLVMVAAAATAVPAGAAAGGRHKLPSMSRQR